MTSFPSRPLRVLLPLIAALGLHTDLLATTYYVAPNFTGGSNDGTTWDTAFFDLQTAIWTATAGDEIWVAAGTYKPISGTVRDATFILRNGVSI